MPRTIRTSRKVDNHRRNALKAGAAFAALPLLSSCSSSDDEPVNDGGSPDNTDGGVISQNALRIGLTIPRTGAYADEGLDQQRGFELAVKHLNGDGDGGMLLTMQPVALQGNGVLGRPVEYVIADTETRSAVAHDVATRLITDEGVSMLVGGSTSGTAIAMQTVAQNLGAVYMSGMAQANDVTGVDGKANAFRHNMNSNIASEALVQTMVRDLGTNRSAYYLVADYSWGSVTSGRIQQISEQLGWQTVATIPTPVGAENFSSYLEPFASSSADVLVLVHYGQDMVNSVAQSRQLGIPDMQVNGNNVALAIPVYSTLMAEAAGGENCANVYGAMNWHWSLQDSASVAFVTSYETEYGLKPSEAAQTIYVQTLQYADAVERAGSFLPCDVVSQLEGHSFSGTGNGTCVYRGEDHQCFKDTLVVAGRAAPVSAEDILEVRSTVARADVTYAVGDAGIADDFGTCTKGL